MMSHDPDLIISLLAIGVLLCACLIGTFVAVMLVLRLRRRLHNSNSSMDGRDTVDDTDIETGHALLREFEKNGQSADAALIDWSPDVLRKILAEELPGAQVIVVSNREPYIHNLVKDEVELVVPASGLVAALEPVTRACNGIWIAYGGGSADHLTVDENDCVQVPPDGPSYTLRRVWLSDEEHDRYYLGFANEGLWPLCHIAFTRPVFRSLDWEIYQAVNRRFADAVISEALNERPIVLVQDYHFALLPRMIRDKLPEAIIITFWHIPWPNSEVFSILPWREAILDGLLGSSIIGFHTQFHCNNFIESVDRFMESRIEREDAAISYGGQISLVHAYPISIEWPQALLDELPSVAECRRKVREKYEIADDTKLCVGVERLDYTKGILDRFRALEDQFERHPEWVGNLTLIQVAAPSRGALPAYKHLHEECFRYANALNRRFGHIGYKPVIMIAEHNTQHQVYEIYRAGDLCMVTSLHDGMNLVAKEFVASRDDEQGVLLLSAFAGASKELLEALIVNPYDVSMMADALQQALTMPAHEQQNRMRRMREIVRENNVYRWAGSMLLDASRLRKRGEMVRATASNQPPPPPPENKIAVLFPHDKAAAL